VRALWISHFVPWPLRGGAYLRSYHLLAELAREAEVSFVTLRSRTGPGATVLDGAREALEAHCERVRILDIPAERLPFARETIVARSLVSGSYDEVWLRSRSMAAAVAEEVASFRPSLVYFDTIGLSQYARGMAGLPLVMNHHNVESHMMRRRAAAARNPVLRSILAVQARRLEAAEAATARTFDLHLAVSVLDRERLAAIHPGIRAEVVPNGTDTDYFAARGSAEPLVPESLVFVGGLHWYPNRSAVEWLLREVVPMLRARRPGFRLTVVGKAPTAEMLRIAREDPRIRLVGEAEDIRPFVRESAVFACPMHEGGGTRLKILDAMAQGVPVVATSMAVEGIDVVDGDSALLADDPSRFVDALIRVFDDRALGERLSRRARAIVEREFAWPDVGERFRAACREAMERRAS